MKLAAYTFFLALFLSTTSLILLVRLAPILGLIDYPDYRKLHTNPIPRVGGLAIIVGILVPMMLWLPMREDIQGYIYAVTLLAAVMVQDDRGNLDFRLKFLIQILVSLIAVLYGGLVITHFPFVPNNNLPHWLGIPFTVFVLVGVTNAINLSDGVDGLAGGTTVLIAGSLGILGHNANDMPALTMALAIVGGSAGFLRYNTHPARVFLGDVGSQCLGFSVGVLAIMITQRSNPALSPVMPILLFGLPILDTVWVMGNRIIAGRSPFSPDRFHIHHRLIDLGLTFYEVVVVIYIAQIILATMALLLAYSWDGLILVLYGLFCIITITTLNIAERTGYCTHREKVCKNSLLSRFIAYTKQTRLTTRVPYGLLNYFLPLLFVFGAFFIENIPFEYSVIALMLAALLVISIRIGHIPYFPLERFIIFLAATAEVYLISISDVLMENYDQYIFFIFASLAVGAALWVRFSSKEFTFNSLDFLFIFILSVVPNLELFHDARVGLVIIETMIAFYACEVVISQKTRKWGALQTGVFTALSIFGIRGII